MSKQDNSGCGITIGGGSLGGILAVVISWSLNKSIGYAIVHFILGWLYVVYALMAHSDKLFSAVP